MSRTVKTKNKFSHFRLQIIRGRTLFKLNIKDDKFGLFITYSQMHTLELPALRDILAGSVGVFSAYNLCHIRTINWDEIITGMSGLSEPFTGTSIYVNRFFQQVPKRNSNTHTTLRHPNASVQSVIRLAKLVAGVKGHTIARNSVK